VRTQASLGKDAPCTRPIERFGDVVAHPILCGLHSSVRSNLDFRSDTYCGGVNPACLRSKYPLPWQAVRHSKGKANDREVVLERLAAAQRDKMFIKAIEV
jgi:hypothetical protein